MGINLSEIIVVFMVALLLFGPEQLPTLARQLGKITAELRKGSNALRREFYNTVYPPDLADEIKTGSRIIRDLKAEVLAPPVGSTGTTSKQRAERDTDAPTVQAPPAPASTDQPEQSDGDK